MRVTAVPTGAGMRSRRRHFVISAALISGALLLLALTSVMNSPFQAFDFYGRAIALRASDFTLRNTAGETVRLSDFRGKFVYLMFGYLGCDLVCHSQALTLLMLNRRITSGRVQFLYLGMDPEHDTPEKIRHYFDARAANFMGLVARDMREAQAVAAEYRAYFSTEPRPDGAPYRIDHPGFIYLIDPVGEIRLLYSGVNLNLDRMLDDLQHLDSESIGAKEQAYEHSQYMDRSVGRAE